MRLCFQLDGPMQRRRLCVAVTLLAQLVAGIGCPLPSASAQATPGGCGQQVCCCGSAVQCKASGCGCSHPAPPPEKPSCCASESEGEPDTPEASDIPPAPVRWMVGISAANCRGGAAHWIGADVALPTPAPMAWQPSWPFCHSVPIVLDLPFHRVDDLNDPPPRFDLI